MGEEHPVRFSVEYPDRPLNRVSSAFRIFTVIPIAIVLASIGGYSSGSYEASSEASTVVIGGTGLLFLPPLLMILFRRKYPRWWYDFNVELLRFQNRVGVYVALMDDRYPSTDEHQSVHLEVPYPDANRLNRLLPLVKWLLAFPHYVVLYFLQIALFVVLVINLFIVLFTGRWNESMRDFCVGVARWHTRVYGYVFLITNKYPPFSLQ